MFVSLTALNQQKKCPNRKAPARKVLRWFFFDTETSSFRSFISTGIAKNGSPSVSLQKPMAIEGASIALPKMPDDEPAITASTTIIFTYFSKKLGLPLSSLNIFFSVISLLSFSYIFKFI